LAEALQTDHGVGLAGMVLLSPVLDFGWWRQPDHAPLPRVSLLPSLAAAGMEKRGDFAPEALAEAEAYAAGDYATDLLRGLQDEAAVARVVARVAGLTGLDAQMVARHAGRIDTDAFARELFGDEGRIASVYDAAVAGDTPVPERRSGRAPDPVLDAMTAPLSGAMRGLYRGTLGWTPDRRYYLLTGGVSRGWRWGDGPGQPEAGGALRRVLALDPAVRVLVVHGYTDLVTPYFASALILRQFPADLAGARLRQETYRGGHMFYTREASRRALRDDAAWVFGD
jgi:carboxypeptidase C (cathepsin A)